MPRPADIPAPLAASPLNPVHVLLLFGMAYGACTIASTLLCHWIGFGETLRDRELVNGTLWSLILAALVATLRPLRESVSTWFRTPQSPLRFSDIAIATLLITAFNVGVHRVLVVMPMVHSNPEYYDFWQLASAYARATSADYVVLALGTLAIGPLHEEVFFRGVLFDAIRARRSLFLAVAATSLLFGIMHGRNGLAAAFAGLVLAFVYLRYGSLWPALLVHVLGNVLVLPPLLAQFTLLKTRAQAQSYEGWFFEFLFAALFVPLALAFWRRFRPT
ncbi:MAG: CPBP family intramembrane metalloprotease [Betaproteobacteria bacterium]|nr:CPBP family intramembrane metalloprotease [Betaproteobacteria bacterium]